MKFYPLFLGTALLAGSLASTGCERRDVVVERTANEQQADETITMTVQKALEASPTYKFPDVQITTFRGKVQLSGFVLTADQKRAAEELTKGVSGVVEVENKISLKQ